MKKIEINDKKIFENYYVDSIINSEYQFSTLFIWQHVYKFKYEIWEMKILEEQNYHIILYAYIKSILSKR